MKDVNITVEEMVAIANAMRALNGIKTVSIIAFICTLVDMVSGESGLSVDEVLGIINRSMKKAHDE